MRLALIASSLAVALALAACQPNVIGSTPDAGDTTVDAGEPLDAGIRGPYPPGPYRVSVPGTIANFVLPGYLSLQSETLVNTLPYDTTLDFQKIRSSVGPTGKPYRYLLIALSAVWCAPCNQESENLGLNGTDHAKIADWQARGGLFMTLLIEGAQHGSKPTRQELENWINTHQVANIIAIDEKQQLSAAGIDPYSFPANLVVDLDTMKMVAGWAGIDDTYAKWEGILGN